VGRYEAVASHPAAPGRRRGDPDVVGAVRVAAVGAGEREDARGGVGIGRAGRHALMESPDWDAAGGAHLDGCIIVVVDLAFECLTVIGLGSAHAVFRVAGAVPLEVAVAGAGRRVAPARPEVERVQPLLELDYPRVALGAISATGVAEVVARPVRQARVLLPGR